MIQQDESKLEQRREILFELKESRRRKLLASHRVMGNSSTYSFTYGVTKLLPALETLGDFFELVSEE